jgi:hypothetical protein
VASFWQRLRQAAAAGTTAGERLRGAPRSANGASSFHLWWTPPVPGPFEEVSAVLNVRRPPSSSHLYFWALQVSFIDQGRKLGAAHTGLQWHPGAPGHTAVNWGGYRPEGPELPGTESTLPFVDSANTRAWAWQPGRPHRLRVWSPAPGTWRASIEDPTGEHPTVPIRDLLVPAGALAEAVVWLEAFAPCEDPATEASWSELTVVQEGVAHQVREVAVNYPPVSAGDCSNTRVVVDGASFVQVTGDPAARRVRSGPLRLPPP